jgi:large subunit ribosomal protein L18
VGTFSSHCQNVRIKFSDLKINDLRDLLTAPLMGGVRREGVTSLKNRKESARLKRKKRVRSRIAGTVERPRLNIFRSVKHIYAQAIVDTIGKTLVSASTLSPELRGSLGHLGNVEAAKKVGELLAKRCLEKGIQKVVFDRNGYLYHGRVKALAEAARTGGLIF